MFASNLNLSHPKLPLYHDRLKHMVDLALVKAIAHHKNPSQNPLPSNPKSLERAFYNVFKAIPKRKQDDAAERFQNVMTAAQRASVYGNLGQVNFASPVSVVDQVKALPLPANMLFSEADVADLDVQIKESGPFFNGAYSKMIKKMAQAAGKTTTARAWRDKPLPQQAATATKLIFSAVSATCVNPNDIRKDETNLAVSTVDDAGAPVSAGPFFVGEFKKGDTIVLGAAGELFSFDISNLTFPAAFPVSIFMVESDWIHNTELAENLSIALSVTAGALATAGLTICILGAAGVVTAPAAFPIFVAIEIAAAVLGLTGIYVLPLLADDISLTASDVLIIDAPVNPDTQFDRTLVVGGFGSRGRGDYNVLLRWTAVG